VRTPQISPTERKKNDKENEGKKEIKRKRGRNKKGMKKEKYYKRNNKNYKF
jgi:hypothetical protein